LAQLKVIRPAIVVCLGRHSARLFFELAGLKFSSILRVRGGVRKVRILEMDLMLLPTLHPAAALYNPRLRGLLESDFRLLGSLISGGQSGLERWLGR
ncbi:MAG: uracil-DNA glycosylase, partial [Thermoprotei archaeon]